MRDIQMYKQIPRWISIEQIKKDWCVVCYLIINWRIGELVEQFEIEPTEEFHKLTAELVYDYAVEGKMPPKEIATTIMNLGDDFMAGNQVKLRAGDYIAIQGYLRNSRG
jgi:hypothetical protein